MSTGTAKTHPSAARNGTGSTTSNPTPASAATATSTTSAARIEANRRNAQKSTGPRTQAGKERSRFNAVKHGQRATLPILPGEDESILQNRMDSWMITLDPRDDVERYLVERAVHVSWQLDRADRAWAARLELDRLDGGKLQTDAQADQVIRLGRRLFWDPRGPIALYPFVTPSFGDPARVSWMPDVEDPNDPPYLLNLLESTALGCAWLLDRWGELGAILEDGFAWQPPDRFKAVRMLGRQPLHAAEDDEILAIYLASHAIEPPPPVPESSTKPGSSSSSPSSSAGPAGRSPFEDILIELRPIECQRFAERVKERMDRMPGPIDAETGRAYLRELVTEQETRLEELLTAHRQREAAGEKARGNFEDSDLGERIRRYQATGNRTLLRIIDMLQKRHREADRAASGGSGKRRGASGKARSADGSGPARVADPLAEVASGSAEVASEDRVGRSSSAGVSDSAGEPDRSSPAPAQASGSVEDLQSGPRPGSGDPRPTAGRDPHAPLATRRSPLEKTTNEPNAPDLAGSPPPGPHSPLATRHSPLPSSHSPLPEPIGPNPSPIARLLHYLLALLLPVLLAVPAAGRPDRGAPDQKASRPSGTDPSGRRFRLDELPTTRPWSVAPRSDAGSGSIAPSGRVPVPVPKGT